MKSDDPQPIRNSPHSVSVSPIIFLSGRDQRFSDAFVFTFHVLFFFSLSGSKQSHGRLGKIPTWTGSDRTRGREGKNESIGVSRSALLLASLWVTVCVLLNVLCCSFKRHMDHTRFYRSYFFPCPASGWEDAPRRRTTYSFPQRHEERSVCRRTVGPSHVFQRRHQADNARSESGEARCHSNIMSSFCRHSHRKWMVDDVKRSEQQFDRSASLRFILAAPLLSSALPGILTVS